MTPELRCYVCGKDAGLKFVVVAMSRGVDRAFIVHTGRCLNLVSGDAVVSAEVIRKEPPQ